MIRARHNKFIIAFLTKYIIWKMRLNFSEVNIIGKYNIEDKPVLIISNHISWWDGFWVMYLNLKLIHKKFYFMMLEEQLIKNWSLMYSGGFSIKRKSKDVLETINYTKELLKDNNNLVLLFPQGKIHSIHNQTIYFEKGLERIISGLEGKIQIIFLVNLTDYGPISKPQVNSYIEEYNIPDFSFGSLQKYYQEFYNKSVDNQINIID